MISRYTRPEMGRIWTEENRWRRILDVELAVCEAQEELGQAPKGVSARIRKRAAFDPARIAEIEKTTKHDVIAFLSNVAEHVGPESRFLHQGLTSSDVLDSGYALQMSEAADLLLAGMDALAAALRRRALEHKMTLQMGRSHGIHAEPTTFGVKLAMFYCEVLRDVERLRRARESIRAGKLSGAVGTFSNIDPEVERRALARLGLEAEPVASQVVQRDRYAEYLTAMAITGGTLEKIAVEVRHLQRTEVLEAEEYFSPGQKGSSAMPHKRNPVNAERITGLARLLRGNAHAALENIALWHERDISHSSVERVIVPDSAIALDFMIHQATDLIDRLIVYPDRMRKNIDLTCGLLFSQQVLLALTQKGLSRDDAYALVQRNAMRVWEQRTDFRRQLESDPEVARRLSAAELDRIFDMRYYVRHVDAIFVKAGLAEPRAKRSAKKSGGRKTAAGARKS